MKEHLPVCSAKEGLTFSFDNSQIIDYRDSYKYMGDLPFSIYFDFETTTGDAIFFYSKMFVISYCMMVLFHKELNYDKIVIFRSFQQSAHERYNISHFKQEHFPFFDHVTLRQLKDAASGVLIKEKSCSFAEMFCIELKFTIDTLKLWFNKAIKPRFFEIEYELRHNRRNKNPKTSDTLCSICDFPINP